MPGSISKVNACKVNLCSNCMHILDEYTKYCCFSYILEMRVHSFVTEHICVLPVYSGWVWNSFHSNSVNGKKLFVYNQNHESFVMDKMAG